MTPHLWKIAALLIAILTSGCASQISAYFNRDLRTDTANFGDKGKVHTVMAVTGERRMVFFADNGRVCPENFPDVSRSFDAKSVLELPGKAVGDKATTAKLDDSIKTSLTITNTRTEASDIIGRLGAIICVAYLNESLTPAEYKAEVNNLVKESLNYLKQRPAAK